jgi:glycine oxidase
VIGSTMEYAGFRPETTPEGLARIFAATTALCPALIRGKLRRTWAGLRPMTPDGLPILGPEAAFDGLWYATGHGRNGILLAGLTGSLVRSLLNGEEPAHDIEAFSPARF